MDPNTGIEQRRQSNVEKIQRILREDKLSDYTLGALFGYEISVEEIDNAEEIAIDLLQHFGLLPSDNDIVFCESALRDSLGNEIVDSNGHPELCGKQFKVSRDESHTRLGFRWRCRGNQLLPGSRKPDPNRWHADNKLNPMKGYLFQGAHMEYRKFIKVLFAVLMNRPVQETVDTTGCSSETVQNYFGFIKEALAVAGWHDQRKVGGPGDVVEMDEMLLVKRKYNRGRIPIGNYWVFGGVSRATKERFAMRVPDRTRVTLFAEILDCVAEGSIIITDGWAGYQGIMPVANNNNLGGIRDGRGNLVYRDHLVIIHDHEFIRPASNLPPLWRNDILPECRDKTFNGRIPQLQLGQLMPFRIHTQNVESQWKDLRDKVQSTSDLEMVDRKIGWWLYKVNVLRRMDTRSEKFVRMLRDITRVYPGPNVKKITPNRPGARLYPSPNLTVPDCECDDCAI